MKWNPRSIAIIVLAWFVLQIGGLFSPGLLDDVDSIYIEIAREMLHRHDFVTPYIDGLRFFDKPPLMYWMAAGSMRLFGEYDWAARIPLALGMLALLLAVYALGLRLYAAISPERHPDRGALYSALALGTAIGPYLYTRFYIPDLIIALWMTLSVHLFLIALERLQQPKVILSGARSAESKDLPDNVPATVTQGSQPRPSALLPCLGFATVLALNLLTKGLIGIVFPVGFVLLYLAFTRQLKLLPKFHVIWSTLMFLAISLPWHILIAIRNPAIAMPPGNELPAKAGWTWFYLYNEHFARFLGKRVPHDYGLTPVWLFWLYGAIWIMPWMIFLPAAIARLHRSLRRQQATAVCWSQDATPAEKNLKLQSASSRMTRNRQAALTVTIWSLMVMLFFTLSSRQEYYQLPAMPAFALMTGGFLALAECTSRGLQDERAWRASLACHRWLLLPLVSLVGCVCGFFAITAPAPMPGADIFTLLSRDPALYNLSLGHIFDLTGAAMGFFRGPLTVVAVGMIVMGPVSYGLRKTRRTFAANLVLAAGMTAVLAAAHEGLVRFYPILGSKDLALAIVAEQQLHPEPALILLDGELTSGSSLIFYTRQPLRLVNGHLNGPWFGGFWPDAPRVFEDEASLRRLWQGPSRVFLMTYVPASRTTDLESFGPVHVVASSGGKTVLTNR